MLEDLAGTWLDIACQPILDIKLYVESHWKIAYRIQIGLRAADTDLSEAFAYAPFQGNIRTYFDQVRTRWFTLPLSSWGRITEAELVFDPQNPDRVELNFFVEDSNLSSILSRPFDRHAESN